MGLTTAPLTLTNARRDDLAPIVVDALVDTDALHLCVPEYVAMQRALDELERRNRTGLMGATVLGTEGQLGAIPIDDMDLVVIPSTRQVVPNPANPNIAASIAKGVH